jgi:hypothetical protein
MSGKTKFRNIISLLGINMQVKEEGNYVVLNIWFDQIKLLDLFRYLPGKSLIHHFGFAGHENEIYECELSDNIKEKVSV